MQIPRNSIIKHQLNTHQPQIRDELRHLFGKKKIGNPTLK